MPTSRGKGTELVGANCHDLVISRLRKTISDPYYYSQYFNSERVDCVTALRRVLSLFKVLI
jgi:hypothetical protein